MNLGKAYNQITLCYGFRGPRSCFLAPPTVGSRGADPVTSDMSVSVCLSVRLSTIWKKWISSYSFEAIFTKRGE